MSASKIVDATAAKVAHAKRVRAAALDSRKAIVTRTSAAEESLGVAAERVARREARASRDQSLAAEATRRAELMAPLLPLQEVHAAFVALAAGVWGGAGG